MEAAPAGSLSHLDWAAFKCYAGRWGALAMLFAMAPEPWYLAETLCLLAELFVPPGLDPVPRFCHTTSLPTLGASSWANYQDVSRQPCRRKTRSSSLQVLTLYQGSGATDVVPHHIAADPGRTKLGRVYASDTRASAIWVRDFNTGLRGSRGHLH